MPKYFFHLRDGVDRLSDPIGVEIGLDAVAKTALKEARALIAQDALKGEIDLDQRIEVEDESGVCVHTLRFADAVRIRSGFK